MGTKILVVNSGSSSIKYRLFGAGDFSVLASGIVEKIGEPGSLLRHRWKNHSGKFDEIAHPLPISNHREGFQHIGNVISEAKVLEGESERCRGFRLRQASLAGGLRPDPVDRKRWENKTRSPKGAMVN